MGAVEASEIIFSALVLIVSAGVTAHIFHGYGSNKWKQSFLGIILVIAVCIQVRQTHFCKIILE
jgi:membrane protein YdbS with pleckstrin-like domain